MNQSYKLSLFLDLGCKPMKDVILHLLNWDIHCPNSTMQQIETMPVVKNGARIEKFCKTAISIEAITQQLSLQDASNNFNSLNLQDTLWYNDCWTWWEEIEARYD